MKNILLLFILFIFLNQNAFAKGNSDSVTYHGHLPVKLDFTGTGARWLAAVLTAPTGFVPIFLCGDDGNGENDCSTHVQKSKSVNPGAKLVVNTWGEGKILIFLAADSVKGCTGIQGTFVGYESAAKAYDLYVRAGKELPVPNRDNSTASLIIGGNEAFLQLNRDFAAQSNGKSGDPCTWVISKDSALKFKN